VEINAVVLGRMIVLLALVLAIAGARAGWRMARRRGLSAGYVALTALVLGLLPPLNLVYLLVLRRRHRIGDP
jgi:hypothetical protein